MTPLATLADRVEGAEHVLCYVDGSWAYFTDQPLDKQWGDDWDDAPYEHNAGDPYDHDGQGIVKVAWDGPFCTPDFQHNNSPWSVKQINAGCVSWLLPGWYSHGTHVPAGSTIAQFEQLVTSEGGRVYFARASASA